MIRTLAAAALCLAAVAAAEPVHSRPLYYDRAIERADLAGRSLRELDLLRNTIFARAGQPFRKRWLHDYFTQQPWYHPTAIDQVRPVSPLDQKNAATVAAYQAGLSHDELAARLDGLASGKSTLGPAEQKIEAMLLRRALGRAGKPAAEATPADAAPSPFDDPAALDRLLTVEQLRDLSRRDLRLLRNMVYARHGRRFKSPLLQEYFARMEWYSVQDDYSDAKLSAIDQRNIKLVRSVEDSLGGPMTDDEQKKDGWFSGA